MIFKFLMISAKTGSEILKVLLKGSLANRKWQPDRDKEGPELVNWHNHVSISENLYPWLQKSTLKHWRWSFFGVRLLSLTINLGILNENSWSIDVGDEYLRFLVANMSFLSTKRPYRSLFGLNSVTNINVGDFQGQSILGNIIWKND